LNSTAFTSFLVITAALAMSSALTTSALAHDDDSTADPATAARVGPATLVQLDDARTASSRYLDVDAAVADGYVDVGAFVPGMGWHYVNSGLIDHRFNPKRPEILVYADDPCGGKRRLVALEYAIPLELSRRAPAGFIDRADVWETNQALGLWTLPAWVWEYNPHGVFAPHNPRVP
jgi:hypothetical protein